MSGLYGEVIAEHFRRPRNQGRIESPDASHEDVDPLCGDRLRIELRSEDGGIAAVRYRADAFIVATAADSLLTRLGEVLVLAAMTQSLLQRLLGGCWTAWGA